MLNTPRFARLFELFGLLGLLSLFGLLSLGLSGCFTRAAGRASVTVSGPRLVAVQPGVWVVANHSTPVFYSDGYYYRDAGGTWQRTASLNGSWVGVQASVVPVRVRGIDRPRRYVGYRAPRGARVRVIRNGRPAQRAVIVRTRRPRAAARARRQVRREVRRDRRQDRREVRRDRRQDRREVRRDRRQDRRDARRDRRRGRRGAVVVESGRSTGVRRVP